MAWFLLELWRVPFWLSILFFVGSRALEEGAGDVGELWSIPTLVGCLWAAVTMVIVLYLSDCTTIVVGSSLDVVWLVPVSLACCLPI